MIKQITDKVWKLAKSRKLAIWLIIILTLASTIGILVPQKRLDSKEYQEWMLNNPGLIKIINTFKLNHLFHSRWFIGLGILFLINLTACTIEQVKLAIRRWKNFEQLNFAIKDLNKTKEYQVNSKLSDTKLKMENVLNKKRYKLNLKNDGLIATKYKWGLWSSVICHIGLIIIIIAALSSMMFKMYGYDPIAEGQVFTERHEDYFYIEEAPFFNEDHLGFKATVKDQRIIYDGNKFDKLETDLAIIKNGRMIKEQTVHKGHPLIYKGVYFYYDKHGYVPLFTLLNKDKDPIYRSFTFFDTIEGKNGEEFNMEYQFPQTNLKIKATFYPDFAIKDGEYITKTELIKNPVVDLEVYKSEKKIYDGLLKQDKPIQLGDKTLTMGEVRGWTGFVISRDPGNTPIFIGFIVALIGMIMIYLVNPRRLKVEFEEVENGTKIYIYGKQDKYKADFELKIKGLVKELYTDCHRQATD
ncbi:MULTISPECIES: cytochrome c biogenesis protein ResB [unclassified Candidatus Frackibacter]|uniref:cytochrome c biogenesis protein ResB n=1 Tax=unclassified Candidatus Frackibacter TaxID=2648818 RepID=UPI0007988B94|nr:MULTISPECIES: cytochrome c biogenesis protein ResB [unclassified Candidatus Frackibacter]KXS44344.1 MAG: hypothetical protein AWU54_776 [Candidatus Frackibacter sp. T328-2]SDC12092.1 Cytochrome c biogenesis protein ResB [Candidatus Frackibacter sp. WG11]SEM36059.1 Cytochrome c biogenesis protein ResB [Candidatus Frackibacter sp. WG12]SFL41292.1 Cytochrome c biogenesis protein ResB [Candidatus Frackibacter sp. WG13]